MCWWIRDYCKSKGGIKEDAKISELSIWDDGVDLDREGKGSGSIGLEGGRIRILGVHMLRYRCTCYIIGAPMSRTDAPGWHSSLFSKPFGKHKKLRSGGQAIPSICDNNVNVWVQEGESEFVRCGVCLSQHSGQWSWWVLDLCCRGCRGAVAGVQGSVSISQSFHPGSSSILSEANQQPCP